jgi:hypothetical protein
MVVERIAQPDHCDGCHQADGCKEAYRRLGCDEGPSVVLPAVVAFLLPLVVLAVSLGGFGWLLEGRIAEPYQTPLALVLALFVTTGLMLVVRLMTQHHRKR